MSAPAWRREPVNPVQSGEVVSRTLEDGTRESALLSSEAVQAWIAAGNTPLPAEA